MIFRPWEDHGQNGAGPHELPLGHSAANEGSFESPERALGARTSPVALTLKLDFSRGFENGKISAVYRPPWPPWGPIGKNNDWILERISFPVE